VDQAVLPENNASAERQSEQPIQVIIGNPPFGVILEQPDIELVQAAGRPDVEGALADLLDGRDASERKGQVAMWMLFI